MAKQYYYFIAGLPAISMDDSKLVYSPEQFREEAKAQLSEADYQLLLLLHLPDEIANLLRLLYKQETELGSEALYSRDYWLEFIAFAKHRLESTDLAIPQAYSKLPCFILKLTCELLLLEEFPLPATEHKFLDGFFAFTEGHGNRFIREWFDLQRNIKNILVAINGRHHEMEYAKYLIGKDETVKNLSHSHAADFGLGKEHPLFDSVQRIWEQNNILYRERGYDVLRNKWIDDQNFFDFFNIDRILGYYSKLRIVNRWLKADAVLGRQVFHDTLDKLENSFDFPVDFNIRIKQK